MRRNWALLREILDELEKCQGGYPVVIAPDEMFSHGGAYVRLSMADHDLGEVCEHVMLLGDAGFANVRDLGPPTDLGPTGVVVNRLTMAGHDFLASARDNQRWKTAMDIVKDKGGAVTVHVLSQILSGLMKKHFGIPD
jgi:hypothetical protein